MMALRPYKKYAVFSGRARRMEFWSFAIFDTVLFYVLAYADVRMGTFLSESSEMGILTSIFTWGALIPRLAVAARRLHDTDRSGWWQLLMFFPIIGWIWLFILLVTAGNSGDNRFGPDPKVS